MRVFDPLLRLLGRRLQRWGAALSGVGRPSQVAQSAQQSAVDPAADARAIWQARVAEIAPGAWQGSKDMSADSRADVAQAGHHLWPGPPTAPTLGEWPANKLASRPSDTHPSHPACAAFTEPSRPAPRASETVSRQLPSLDARPLRDDFPIEEPAAQPNSKVDAAASRPRAWRDRVPALFVLRLLGERVRQIVQATPARRDSSPKGRDKVSSKAIPRAKTGAPNAVQPSWRHRLVPLWPLLRAVHPATPVFTPAAGEPRYRRGPMSLPVVMSYKDVAPVPVAALPTLRSTEPITRAVASQGTAQRRAERPQRSVLSLHTLLVRRPAPTASYAAFESLTEEPTVHHWPALPDWPASEPTLEKTDRGAAARARRLEAEQRG